MSFGFNVRDASGNLSLVSSDLAIQFIDLFSVSPTSSGTKTYSNIGYSNVIAVATADEPTITNLASFMSANYINLTTTIQTSSVNVSWSPKYQSGTVYNVNIYVFGY